MNVRQTVLKVANTVLRPSGLRLANAAVLDASILPWGSPPPTFRFAGKDYPYFCHHYNCGWPAAWASERAVELALADAWLAAAPPAEVIEVGAVTPYYWPGRVGRVADPADRHPQVTDRTTMDRLDLTGMRVLCLSSLEHFGSGDYGLPPNPAELYAAVAQLAAQPCAVLATIPVGYNPVADDLVLDSGLPVGFRVRFLIRDLACMAWREASAADARLPYTRERGASAVAVLDRG